jgi:hypothetical protein
MSSQIRKVVVVRVLEKQRKISRKKRAHNLKFKFMRIWKF